jgi:hypothetical protein
MWMQAASLRVVVMCREKACCRPANSQQNFAETSFSGGFRRRKNIDKMMSSLLFLLRRAAHYIAKMIDG